MARKLQYFDTTGLAESIRYMLHYGEQKFEDIRHDHTKWPIKTVKDSLPHGYTLPVYHEGSKVLDQSLAIAKYIGNQLILVPTDPWEQALLDSVVYTMYDFWTRVVEFIMEKDPVKKAALKKEILDVTINHFFTRFEKTLAENNGHFGGKLTWADFILAGIVEGTNQFVGIKLENNYPRIKVLIEKIRNYPGVKAYIASRKQ